jgi:hypothetical protein
MVLVTGGGGITAGKGQLTKKKNQSNLKVVDISDGKFESWIQVDAKSKPWGRR